INVPPQQTAAVVVMQPVQEPSQPSFAAADSTGSFGSPTLPTNQGTQIELERMELDRIAREQQQSLLISIDARLAGLTETNQQGFSELGQPRIQDVRPISDGPTEAASPAESIA
ncbi:MAG: hypothetical protein ABJZ55_26150, partial [Fuerstiella sp.]